MTAVPSSTTKSARAKRATRFLPVLVPALVTSLASFAPAQEEAAAPPAGVWMHVSNEAGATQLRRTRFVALRVKKGDAPSAFVPAGKFTAEWRGTITVPLRDRYTFSFEGFGSAALTINGKAVFDLSSKERAVLDAPKRTRLKKGPNSIVLRFESLPDGSGACRLLWKGFGFARELVPQSVFTAPDVLNDWLGKERSGLAAANGRTIVAQRQCITCHEVDGKTRMHELKRQGRALNGAGARLAESWMASWILDPKKLRPSTRMPHVLHGDESSKWRDARDLAAFFATLREGADEFPELSAGVPEKGGELFAALGCVSCHTRPDRPVDAKSDRIPLTYTRAKWTSRAALAAFLAKPNAHDRWIRMPNFDFSDEELANLSAFLWKASKDLPLPAPVSGEAYAAGDAARGKELVTKVGCASCHPITGIKANKAKPWAELDAADGRPTCVQGSHPGLPSFALSNEEMRALRDFMRVDTKGASFANHSPAEYAERQVVELSCTSCHGYDGLTDDWSRLESEVADLAAKTAADEVDQMRPHLTWSGEKLRSDWFQRFVSGKEKDKPRRWLHARMPRFKTHARGLADGFAAMHGLDRTKKSEIAKPRAKLANAGLRIVGIKGHSCTTCHAVGSGGATMVFESPGLNLNLASSRLREQFYLQWMLDPQRYDVRTKMTKFADEKGRTQLEDFDGDAAAQFSAVWQYLLEGAKIRVPKFQ